MDNLNLKGRTFFIHAPCSCLKFIIAFEQRMRKNTVLCTLEMKKLKLQII